MEVTESNVIIFYGSTIFGLAPYAIRRNFKGFLEIRRSVFLSIYSVCLILLLVVLTYNGLLFDAHSKLPIRMKSATSKVVSALDISVVVLATTAGTICGMLAVKSTNELNTKLHKIDVSLDFYKHKRDRCISIITMSLILLVITILLGLDIWTSMELANTMKSTEDGNSAGTNVKWYIPYYILYYILTFEHIKFAHTTFGIARRFRRLNVVLRNSFLKAERNAIVPVRKQTIFSVNSLNSIILNINAKKTNDETYLETGQKMILLIKQMADSHDALCRCVELVSSSHGLEVLFILISCLLHLVATSYFLCLEVLNSKSLKFLWLQVLWILFHIIRLVMIVESCHRATVESKKTLQIVCAIERKTHDAIFLQELKKFWKQLLVQSSDFTALGLCKVNRTILTSFSGAIATYLVILLQFQKTNG